MWAVLLSMCGGEVDRAIALEDTLTEEWYLRWTAWNEETARVRK